MAAPKSSQTSGSGGPLGNLPGFTFDPIKKRYFPTPPASTVKSARQIRDDGLRGGKQHHGRRKGEGRSLDAEGGRGGSSARTGHDLQHKKRGGAGQPDLMAGVNQSTDVRRVPQPLDESQLHIASSLSWRASDSRLHRRNRTSSLYSALSTIPISNAEPFASPLTTICSLPGRQGLILGDESGAIHAVRMEVCPVGMGMGMGLGWEGRYSETGGGYGSTERVESRRNGMRQGGLGMSRWVWQEINLGRKITGLQIENDVFLATTFGPSPRLFVSPLPAMLNSFAPRLGPFSGGHAGEAEKPSSLWEMNKLKDCWGMSCKDGGLVMGGNGQVVSSSTVFSSHHAGYSHFTSYPTIGQSDALSVVQLNKNEALAGLRSSHVMHFDFRLDPGKAGTERCYLGAGKSVFGIKALGDTYGVGTNVIASAGGDELSLWDLRWTKGASVIRYKEHVNDYRPGLGLGIDPTQSTLAAAGSDGRVRLWDLASGAACNPPTIIGGSDRKAGPRARVYDNPVTGIDFTEQGVVQILHGREMELYAHPGVKLGL